MTVEMGTALREMRKRSGYTLRHVASRTGVHYTYLSKCETGKEEPGLELLCALGILYGEDITPVRAPSGRRATRLSAENEQLRAINAELLAACRETVRDQGPCLADRDCGECYICLSRAAIAKAEVMP
ncbi:MAG: helix-turn-helix domain-containing protein [Cyanobacteria bacterium REEB65]|nr:helix-turn-helix domain-containing protein [Cyanobacteria bacterium REEB65]